MIAPPYLTALGDAIDTAPRSIKSFGPIVGDGVTDQTTQLINAFASGARNLIFPADVGPYVIDGSVKVPPGMRISGEKGAVLLQKLTCHSALDAVGADDIDIRVLSFQADYDRTFVRGGYRGDNLYSSGAAIYHSGSRSTFQNLTVEGFCTGVFLGAWDEATQSEIGGRVGNLVTKVHFKRCDFGVLAKGQVALKLTSLLGENMTLSAKSPNPQHTIYVSGSHRLRSSDLLIEDITTNGCHASAGVQVKWTDGLIARKLVSSEAGALSLTSVTNFEVDDVVARLAHSIGDGVGALLMFLQYDVAENICSHGQFSNILLDMKAGADRCATLIGNNCRGRFVAYPNRTAPGGEEFSIGGSNNAYDIRLLNNGSSYATAVSIRPSANVASLDNNMIQVEAKGVDSLVRVASSATKTRIHYDPLACSTVQDLPYVFNHGVGTILRRAEAEFTLEVDPARNTIGDTDPNAIRGARASRFIIPIGHPSRPDTSAHTIASPHESKIDRTPVGTIIEVIVRNLNATEALGSLGWGSLWRFKAPFVAPPAGRSSRAAFRFDGTNWLQV